MTTIPPPSSQFTGIFYNPSFWISSATSLTQSVANTLYLRKTTTDSASALETFNAGISTQTMTAPSLTADVTLFPNQTAGTLKLATASRSVHCSNIDCQGNAINNASTPANGALTFGASQTGGTIEIGKNVARTGAITIGHNNCTLNIGGHLTPTYTVAPVAGEIGFRLLLTNTYSTNTGLTSGTTLSPAPINQVLPFGIWLVQGCLRLIITATTNISATQLDILQGGTIFGRNTSGEGVLGSTSYYPAATAVIVADGTAALTVNYNVTFTVSSVTIQAGTSNFYWYATRIA